MHHRSGWLLLLLGMLLPVAPIEAAVEYRWVGDAVAAPAAVGSNPNGFFRLGDEVVYAADKPETGIELFATQTATGATRLVADLAPNGASSNPVMLGQIGTRLIVGAEAGALDGGEFPLQRMDEIVAVAPASGQYQVLTQFGARFDFQPRRFERLAQFAGVVAFKDRTDDSIWASDGTVSGTQRIYATGMGWLQGFCAMHDRFLFMTYTGSSGNRLWISNGLTLGTGIIAELPGGPVDAASRGDGCYFLVTPPTAQWPVWLSNGTAPGTGQVAQVPAGDQATLHVLDAAALVLVRHSTQARLWRVGNETPLWEGSLYAAWPLAPAQQVVVGDRLLFSGRTATGAQTLISDGTVDGTVEIGVAQGPGGPWLDPVLYAGDGFALASAGGYSYRIDLAAAWAVPIPGAPGLFTPGDTLVHDGAVIGARYSDDHGYEVWRSDGTGAGTRLLSDIATATLSGAEAVDSVAVSRSGVLLYAAIDDLNPPFPPLARWSLWRSDGTLAGTRPLLRDAYDDRDVTAVRALGDSVLFTTSRDPVGPGRLYRTDTAFATTTLLWEQEWAIHDLRTSDAAVFFNCTYEQRGTLCAIRDGETQVVPLLPGSASFQYLGTLGDSAFYFTAQGLLRSDGTPSGTFPVGSLRSPASSERISQRVGNALYFEACSDGTQYSCGLYVSDGSIAGTRLIKRLYFAIEFMQQFGDGIAFVLATGSPPRSLWTSDGTAAETRKVADLDAYLLGMASTGSRIHLLTNGAALPNRYVVSDGTAAGTIVKTMPEGIVLDATSAPVVVDEDNVMFRCLPRNLGNELCSVDGDGNGFQVVGDFYQGPRSSFSGFLARMGGAAYYAIDDGRHGHELWRFSGDHIFADGFH